MVFSSRANRAVYNLTKTYRIKPTVSVTLVDNVDFENDDYLVP